MQTCHSKTYVSDENACSMKCLDYDFTSKGEMEKRHSKCTEKCLKTFNNRPTAIGCFGDEADRDLRNFLGNDLTVEECIKKGQDTPGTVYVGLQNGNECWGDDSLGRYDKVEDNRCNMPCVKDINQRCGGGWSNLVYDLRSLNR